MIAKTLIITSKRSMKKPIYVEDPIIQENEVEWIDIGDPIINEVEIQVNEVEYINVDVM